MPSVRLDSDGLGWVEAGLALYVWVVTYAYPMSEWEGPEYGELEWERAFASFGVNDGRIEITVRIREQRGEPWRFVFNEVANTDQPKDAGWSSVFATSTEVVILGLVQGSEEPARNFVERSVQRADALANKIVVAAEEMVAEFHRLSEDPPS